MDQAYARHLWPAGAEGRGGAPAAPARLQRAFAIDLVRSGAPVHVVRDALGHASLATTQVNLTRVGALEAVDGERRAEISVEPDMGLVEALYRQTRMATTTTPAGSH